MARVSVIVPTFNRVATVGRALSSILGQTVVPDEVIVVDDGSTDGTVDMVRRFPGVKLICLEVNAGAAHARNVGIRAATGDFVAFLDSDDLWLCNKLEVQLAEMNERHAPLLLASGVTVHRLEGGTDYYQGSASKAPGRWTFEDFQNYSFSTPTWLVKRQAVLDAGLFDESLPNREDLDLLARLNEAGEIGVVTQPLVVKYNLADSLDADPERLARSLEILFSRYPDKWCESNRLAVRNCRRLARIAFSAGDVDNARRALRRALEFRFFTPMVWLMLGASFLGTPMYFRMQNIVSKARKRGN